LFAAGLQEMPNTRQNMPTAEQNRAGRVETVASGSAAGDRRGRRLRTMIVVTTRGLEDERRPPADSGGDDTADQRAPARRADPAPTR